ncbi:MAG: putative bifunctional diguanylate cyclase/phosphodiesterase [Lysinibacillus sp.]
MIRVIQEERKEALQQIVRLNPFDAVVMLKRVKSRHVIEDANDIACQLFGPLVEKEPDAACFFGWEDWQALHSAITEEKEAVQYIKLQAGGLFACYAQDLPVNGEPLLFAILRPIVHHERAAYEDELTGLWNRRALHNRWTAFVKTGGMMNTALFMVNLDRFKKFNESLGKPMADGMIAIISGWFKGLCTGHCEVFRYNGDEFVFVLRYHEQEEVERLAADILALLKRPIVVEQQDYYVTASIGIAISIAEQNPQLDTMLHHADQALFHVKNHGGNHYRFFQKDMNQEFPNEALLEAHLRRAIELDELSIHFQPQIDLDSKRSNSFEALLRWHNRKFGFVSPGQFIPLAESSGLILEIGDWVLNRVGMYMQEWRDKGYRPVRIAVNISPKQFKQEDFVEKIERLIRDYELDPSLLELEITESSMTNVKDTTLVLKELKKLGVYVSVDDFGTGYSSLSYLKTYPIDIIKIDQSFIADIERDEKNEAIIEAIISLSHSLGLEVIAEGVERENQERFLSGLKCKKVQGYLYDRPLPVEKMIMQYLMK